MELRSKLILGLFIIVLTSCLPEEDPINPVPKGGFSIVQVEMGSGYEHQIWYDLSAQAVVATNSRFAYDLIYNPNASVAPITLNAARISSIASLETTDFSTVPTLDELTFYVSNANGNPDSSAFSKVNYQEGNVYLLKIGVKEDGTQAGYRKLRITTAESGSLVLEHGALKATQPEVLELPALAEGTQQAIVFSENRLLDILPAADAYDVVFTNYTHVFTEPSYLIYSVTGMLMNEGNVQATELKTELPFDQITAADAQSVEWTYETDVVGYDWKSFSLETNSFSVDANRFFLLKDRYGYTYKLRFVDFYSTQGEKGYPTFEIEPL